MQYNPRKFHNDIRPLPRCFVRCTHLKTKQLLVEGAPKFSSLFYKLSLRLLGGCPVIATIQELKLTFSHQHKVQLRLGPSSMQSEHFMLGLTCDGGGYSRLPGLDPSLAELAGKILIAHTCASYTCEFM